MKVNIKTISEMTGFSQATISNVLHNKRGVSAQTADTVLKAAREIGYLNNTRIESIKLVMYKKEGRILTETPLISALLEGVESEGHLNGLNTLIINIKENEGDFKAKLEQITRERNSGVVLLATELDWPDMRAFLDMTAPLVVVDAWFREGKFDTVLMDNSDSLFTSVSYLVEKGHRSIGYIDSSIPIRNFHYRKKGFAEAMGLFGLEVEGRYCTALDPTMAGAYEDMKKYLDAGPELPTAYCAVNDIVAFGAMKALQEKGVKIPDEVSIIGFDNMPFCEMASPSLTTINVPKKELGQIAVRRLLAQCGGGSVNMKNQLLTTLVERNSVKNISH